MKGSKNKRSVVDKPTESYLAKRVGKIQHANLPDSGSDDLIQRCS